MFASQVFFLLLALVAFVANALPVHSHHRRIACRAHTSSSAAGAAPTTRQNAVANSQATTTSISDDTTSTPKPTKSGTSSPSPSPNTSSASGNSLLRALFPVSEITGSWTTSSAAKNPLPLSDGTFRLHSDIKSLPRNYIAAPDGKMSMRAHYPQGSVALQNHAGGGISFYAPGPTEVDLKTAREATLGYSVFFDKGFEWNKGGKLPGLYGGTSEEAAKGCGGGSRSRQCFSTRLMWRGAAAGELYTYFPPGNPANNKQCDVAPQSDCNPTYGASVGRGAFHFAAGQWTTVSQRIKLNTVGKADGEMELFANGKSVINVKGLVLRETDAGRFRGIMMQTFFGGHTADFASPKTQNAYFSDFSVAITETF